MATIRVAIESPTASTQPNGRDGTSPWGWPLGPRLATLLRDGAGVEVTHLGKRWALHAGTIDLALTNRQAGELASLLADSIAWSLVGSVHSRPTSQAGLPTSSAP